MYKYMLFPRDIFRDTDNFSKNEIIAILAIINALDFNDGEISYKEIAEKMRCSKRTAIDVIKSLEEKGVILKYKRKETNGSQGANIYRLKYADEMKEIYIHGQGEKIKWITSR